LGHHFGFIPNREQKKGGTRARKGKPPKREPREPGKKESFNPLAWGHGFTHTFWEFWELISRVIFQRLFNLWAFGTGISFYNGKGKVFKLRAKLGVFKQKGGGFLGNFPFKEGNWGHLNSVGVGLNLGFPEEGFHWEPVVKQVFPSFKVEVRNLLKGLLLKGVNLIWGKLLTFQTEVFGAHLKFNKGGNITPFYGGPRKLLWFGGAKLCYITPFGGKREGGL